MIHEKTINLKEFEENLYAFVCRIGQEYFKETLENWDKELFESRDRSVYRDKGKRKTVLKTLMGEVEYNRHVYVFTDENGRNGTVYLLDEKIGKMGSGFFSEALSERIASAVCELPYRKAAETISKLTGQSISHTAAWNVTQHLGERVDEIELEYAKQAKKNESIGNIETKVLFEEQDGIRLHLQGAARKEFGKGREMKLCIAYDGVKKTGDKRYALTNKVACSNFETVSKFYRRKEGVIAANYNVDEIDIRVLNGDGAGWIKHKKSADTLYQLDTYHRNRAIVSAAPDERSREDIFKTLYSGDIEHLLVYIETLADNVEDEKQEKRLRELYKYFSNNKNGLVPYSKRGAKIPEVPLDKEYRRLGAMESNIFTIIGNRMKGRRKCWSINGGNNLSRLLCLKATGKLNKVVVMVSAQMPEKYAEEIVTQFSSAKTQSSVGEGYNGYKDFLIPSSQKWFKDIAKIRPV